MVSLYINKFAVLNRMPFKANSIQFVFMAFMCTVLLIYGICFHSLGDLRRKIVSTNFQFIQPNVAWKGEAIWVLEFNKFTRPKVARDVFFVKTYVSNYSNLHPKHVSNHSNLHPKHVSNYSNPHPKHVSNYSNLHPKHVLNYSNLHPKHVSNNSNLHPKHVLNYSNLHPKHVSNNSNLYPKHVLNYSILHPIHFSNNSYFHQLPHRNASYYMDGKFIRNIENPGIHLLKDKAFIKHLQNLGTDLKNKLEFNVPPDSLVETRTCILKEVLAKSCPKNGCFQKQLPKDPLTRVEQLIRPPRMRPNYQYQKVLAEMRNSVKGVYDIMFVTAASGDHYLESKALLANLQMNVFPHLKNVTLIYYDLGLTEYQNADISRFCHECQVRKFPFSQFPEFFKTLKCYSWKPMIVYAHAPRSRLIFWVDASIRMFNTSQKLNRLFSLAAARGVQSGVTLSKLPWVTLTPSFHFFGDEPCAYHSYHQCSSGLMLFHNEPLILEAVLRPWAGCALTESCMCPRRSDLNDTILCPRYKVTRQLPEYKYERCHRFDQSTISIIIRKLFQEKSHHIFNRQIFDVLRVRRRDEWGKNNTVIRRDGSRPRVLMAKTTARTRPDDRFVYLEN